MKIRLQLLCLLVFGVAVLTACGRDNQQDWMAAGVDELPPGTRIVEHISSRFAVYVIPELIQGGYDENNPPNIFIASSNPHDLLQSRITRTIHMDMIRRYAPSYYNLLMSIPFGLGAYTEHATGDLIGLPIYRDVNEELWIYSAYRLDWLERHNSSLPDNIVPIREGEIYFTPTPFTQEQFIEIIGAFSESTVRIVTGCKTFNSTTGNRAIWRFRGRYAVGIAI